MNDVHVITYATHDQGMFKELVNNKQGIPVKVLGWGDKWVNFIENKVKGVYKYLKTLPTDTIVIFVDGFDTIINGTLEEAKKEFLKFNKDIVVSIDHANSYMISRFFGRCNNISLNTGLLMGYAGPLSDIYRRIIDSEPKDDQRGFTTICKQSDNIVIDTERKIFSNNDNHYSIFNGYPACAMCSPMEKSKRIFIRCIPEYIYNGYTFIPEVIIAALISYYIKKPFIIVLISLFIVLECLWALVSRTSNILGPKVVEQQTDRKSHRR